jgi:hypothetical protein
MAKTRTARSRKNDSPPVRSGTTRREIAEYLRASSRRARRVTAPTAVKPRWSRVSLVVLLTMLSLVMLGCETAATEKRSVLSGQVLDTTGYRIVGAVITSHRSLYKAGTDKEGRYSFTSLDAGSHILQVEKNGYRTASRTIQIDAATVKEQIDFRLEPLPNQVSWTMFSRASGSVIVDVVTLEPMKCQAVFQGRFYSQTRTPFTPFGTEHRLVLSPLLPGEYSLFIDAETPDGRKYVSASGTVSTAAPGDLPGAPPVPEDFRVTQAPGGIKVSWQYTGTDLLKGFRIYRAEDDEPLELWQDEDSCFANLSSWLDDEPNPGMLTRYALEAVDLEGNVSSRTLEIAVLPGGTLKEDIVWKQNWGVLNLAGDIQVPAGTLLTIEPGVSVRVNPVDLSTSGVDAGACEIIVDGRLQVLGTKEQPVRLFSGSATPSRTDWAGVLLRTPIDQLPSSISFLEVANAREGLSLRDRNATCTMVLARKCETGLAIQGVLQAVVTGVTATDCGTGVVVQNSREIRLENVTCTDCTTGVSMVGNRNTVLWKGDVRGAVEIGLNLTDAVGLAVSNYVVHSRKLGIRIGRGVTKCRFMTVDAVNALLIEQSDQPDVRNVILVNRLKPNTGKGLEDVYGTRSHPYTNIFGFLTPLVNADQNGGPVLNVDPQFVGGTAALYDYRLQDGSPLKTASEKNAEIGAYGSD